MTDPLETAVREHHRPDEDATLVRLHARLAAAAENADLLDVAYATVDSPVGSLLLAATPVGLVRVAYAVEDHDAVLASLADRISPRILRTPARLDVVRRELDDYFAGRRRAFDVPLDQRLSAGFRLVAQQEIARIAYGRTRSYGELAALVGNPGAVRAVGTACATNPLPVVVPCHRVLRSDGSLGGYVGGAAVKAQLLALETAA